MHIDWNVPIVMDDGLTLRADVYRPLAVGAFPTILSYGPYAKGLAFQEGYPSAWERMIAAHSMARNRSLVSRGEKWSMNPEEHPQPRESTRTQT